MATKLILFSAVLFALWMVAIGTRDFKRCVDKLQGPFDEFNHSRPVLHLKANSSNDFTVPIVCRITCQEAGAIYRPELRIVADGEYYENTSQWKEASHLFNVTIQSPSEKFACDPNNNVKDHKFHMKLSRYLNTIIANCGLRYTSRHGSDEFCFTDRLAWISIPETDDDDRTTTPLSYAATTTTELTTPIAGVSGSGEEDSRQEGGNSGSTIVPIVVAVVAVLGNVILTLLLAVVVYKARQRVRWIRVIPRNLESGAGTQPPPYYDEKQHACTTQDLETQQTPIPHEPDEPADFCQLQ